jgi:FAD/FMN-containing dehydrogenase
VQYAVSHNLKFLARSGGHGFTTTLSKSPADILIDLRPLRKVSINLPARTVVIEAGALVSEALVEGYKAKAHLGMITKT